MRIPFFHIWRIRFYRGKYVMLKLYMHVGESGITWKPKKYKTMVDDE